MAEAEMENPHNSTTQPSFVPNKYDNIVAMHANKLNA